MSKILAHRGASHLAPQNTLAAFKKALEIGVDGFENDVHLTKDGEIVVCHNYDIDDTSNGTGKISEMTFEELRRYDFGAYFGKEFEGERIPTLDEFLELSRDLEVVNIELKVPKEKNDLVKKTLDRVKAFGMEENVIFSSFSYELLEESKALNPNVKTGFLYDLKCSHMFEISADPGAFCKKHSLDALHPVAFFINEEYVSKCHEAGIIINTWTVNDKDAMMQLNEVGVDGIITDTPELWKS